jgi:hypothetical protein
MAMTTSRGSGGGSYSYTVTETYTLEEAIRKASTGSLTPSDVYRQMPEEIQGEVDSLARRRYSKAFSSLGYSEQCQVMAELAAEVKRAKEEAEKPVSAFDALRLASEGKIDDVKLYDALPQELRTPMDALAQGLRSSDFKRAKPEVRSQVLKIVLEALTEQATNNAAEVGLQWHNQALELKKNGSSVEALKMMRDAEKALSKYDGSNPSVPTGDVTTYCNLSSARAHIGDWTSETSLLSSAITAADRGLALDEGSASGTSFNRAVLLHNRGHAGWRLGELNQNRATLRRAIEDIAAAQALFTAGRNSEALRENADLSRQAIAALAKLRERAGRSSHHNAVAAAAGAAPMSPPHRSADAQAASDRNIEYRKALREWSALPWWKRVRTSKPTPPPGFIA